jgi:hypothetical protein
LTSQTQTAAGLLIALERDGNLPRVVPDGIRFDRPPPAELLTTIRVLQTGIRAALTGRMWFGLSSDTGWAQALNPAELIPGWVSCLAVQGDAKWDRIPEPGVLELPKLFADVPEPKPSERLPRPKKARAVA